MKLVWLEKNKKKSECFPLPETHIIGQCVFYDGEEKVFIN